MCRPFRLAGVVCLALLVCAATDAGTGSRVWFVPWKVLEHGDVPPQALMTLYWVPSSADELRRSPLLTSRALAVYASRCVAMQVIRVDDTERLVSLQAGSELPVAFLVDGRGEVARVPAGTFVTADVEMMVRDAFDRREFAAQDLLDRARRAVSDGDADGAATMYREVVKARCAFPRLAKEAQRALKKLGAPEVASTP